MRGHLHVRAPVCNLLLGTILVAACAIAQERPPVDKPKDEAAIGRTVQRFVDAWNYHDAHAFSLTFTEDCDFTNVAGTHAHGRDNVEKFHAPVFTTVFKKSHQTAKIRSIRFIAVDFAAVDVDWQMTGAIFPDGRPQPERHGLLDWLMARQADGSWLIQIMHNTDLTNMPPPK